MRPCFCLTATLLVHSARLRRPRQRDLEKLAFAKMSWFHHVNQSSGQPGQCPLGSRGLSSANAACSGFNPRPGGPALGSPTAAHRRRGGRSTSSPSVTAGGPPSLEELSGSSPAAARVRDPGPISYLSLQEQRCVLGWFSGWNAPQRERFFQDLLGKAVPGKVCTLLDSLSTLQVPHAFMLFRIRPRGHPPVSADVAWVPSFLLPSVQVNDKLPNIFECQMRLWTQWFESWREDERNHFLHALEEQEPTFADLFYRSVAGTAGRD